MSRFIARLSKRTRWIIGVCAAAAVILFIALAGGRRDVATEFETEPAARGRLTATVGATGSVRAQRSAVLKWQTNGSVEGVAARVGDEVAAGDTLANLEPRSVPQNVILAEADLAATQRTLDDLLESDTARARALIGLKQAQDDYEDAYNYRVKLNGPAWFKKVVVRMVNHQPVSEIKWYRGTADAATIAGAEDELALKQALLEDAQRAFDRLERGPASADVAAAQARVAAAQATLDMARVVAPFAGTVTQAMPAVGDQVTAAQPAFRVDDLSHLLVDVQVSEVDINTVSVGQAVGLSFDAILDHSYHGNVIAVGQAGDTVEGVVSFTVTVEISDADELVKPGMTAAVNVVVTELDDVLLIPNRAVRLVDGERVVYILRDGMPVPVKVQLGQSSGEQSAVVGGDLSDGDLVILNPPSLMRGPFGG